MAKEALFLDRDGLIIHMVQYPDGYDSAQKVADVKLVPGIEDVIQAARGKGWAVIEVTNQPGVAKGKLTQELSDSIENRIHELLEEKGVKVDGIYVCPHHKEAIIPELRVDCGCRKPKPGLLQKASKEHDIDLPSSIFYGDKATEVQAATAAGCKSIILLHNEDTPNKVVEARNAEAGYKVNTHKEAVKIISEL